MIRFTYLRVLTCAVVTTLILVSAGCRKGVESPGWMLAAPGGPVTWDTLETAGIIVENYQDRGVEKQCLLVSGDSSAALHLKSPLLDLASGRTVAFTFALRRERARGRVFEARLRLFGADGAPVADTLLYALDNQEDGGRGDTRRWISYTRSIQVPEGAAGARIELVSSPTAGEVRLGETAFSLDEGWLGYAATFSAWLGQSPVDKYVYTAGRIIEPQAEPEPSQRETRSGFLVFERKDLVDAWPYTNPRDMDCPSVFVEKAPRTATAPFAIGVKALEDLPSVELSLTRPFSGPQGELKTRPRLYQARFAATRLEGSWSREFGVRTRILERPRQKPLPSGEARFFWIDVQVPESAAPGVYETEALIRAGDRAAFSLPLRLEVLPLTLPLLAADNAAQVGFYYYPPLDNPQLMDLQLRDMAAHGAGALSLGGSFVNRTGERFLALDLERVRKLHNLMLMMRRLGFFRPTPFYIADLPQHLNLPEKVAEWTEEDKHLYERAVRMMDDTARNWSWPRLLFFPVDEPANNPEHMELARLTLGILHGMNGILTLCDLNSPNSIRELSRYLDAVVMQISSVSPETLELERQDSVQTYFYLPAFGSADVGPDADFHRAIPGWFLPRTGARGIYYFAYQSVEGDPYDELDGNNRDWCAAYPSQDSDDLWPSPEYQGIRRGIEDLRLVELARSLSAVCLASQEQAVRDAGQKAKDSLDRIINALQPDGDGVIYQLRNELSPYAADSWREETVSRIVEMQAALKPGV